jgi:hypothetical protein
MSIYRVNPGDVSTVTVVTNPFRTYVTSSAGATGSVYVFPRRSSIEKEMAPLSSFIESTHDDSDLETLLRVVQQKGKYAYVTGSMSASFEGMLDSYLTKVNAQQTSVRKQKSIDVARFTPTVTWTTNTVKKLVIKDILSQYYRVSYPSAHWAYTNYNCLNFFTSSGVPTTAALLYPNIVGGPSHVGYVSGVYVPSGAFSFDFYVKPSRRPERLGITFNAGTIFHLSSTYALSLVTGSGKDHNGLVTGFRLQLQLSHSADVMPSLATTGTYPNDLTFLSNDNSLKWNRWHHVIVRWGTSLVNGGTGSFNVDGVDEGEFLVPSSTIAPLEFPAGGPSSPDVLCIGNYFQGNNLGTGSLSYFFSEDPSTRDGLEVLNTEAGYEGPADADYDFTNPLNAELHDLSIKRYYMSDLDIVQSASVGLTYIDPDRIAFYVPPFFVEDSPFRQFVGTHGGVLQTPFFEVDGSTNDPFNVAMSFGVNGHYINLENYVRDFANGTHPRLHHLTGVALVNTTVSAGANEFLYDQPFVKYRNLMLLPCDDGLFVPQFSLLASESNRSSIVDDFGVQELSFVNIGNMLLTSSLLFGSDFDEDSELVDAIVGFSPENPGKVAGTAYDNYADQVSKEVALGTYDPGIQKGAPLTIYQRTRDSSSNQVTFFDISNIFYGKRILPGSVTLKDSSLYGSDDAFGITLKDDGRGTLYRADCVTSASTWNAVGTVFYDEGIIAIKSPHLYFFGKEGYELSFRGEQNIHVMRLDVIAPANQLNSSSNLNYVDVPPSAYPNDPDENFVYITGINFHDDNMNVVMKSQLAQPIIKRTGSKIKFTIRHDF